MDNVDWRQAAKAAKVKQAEIVTWFFESSPEDADEGNYICQGCRQLCWCRNAQVSGYKNLFSHLENVHPGFEEVVREHLQNPTGSIDLGRLNSQKTKTAINLCKWIEWVVMYDLPFSFVDSELTRRNSNLTPISSKTLLSGMERLGRKIEEEIKSILPHSFGIIFDGWSEGGTHFLALIAVFYCPLNILATDDGKCYALLSMAPLLDETSFTAEEHISYLKEMLRYYGKTTQNVTFLIADNCNTNICISRTLVIPLIGCSSHKLHLAVKLIFDSHSALLSKVKEAITELQTLKNRGFLRSIDAVGPVSWNDTRWTSMFQAMDRYLRLHEILSVTEDVPVTLKAKLLSDEEYDELVELRDRLNLLHSTTEYLQGEKCNLAHARTLLDAIIEKFGDVEGVEEKIGDDGDLVVDSVFERAIVKVLRNQLTSLSRNEKEKLKRFEVSEPASTTPAPGNKRLNEAADIIEREYGKKKQKYSNLEHIPGTSVVVERLFSKAKIIYEPRRRSMTPFHLELLLYLKFNRVLWSVESLIEW